VIEVKALVEDEAHRFFVTSRFHPHDTPIEV
jgi:hypothetical protein